MTAQDIIGMGTSTVDMLSDSALGYLPAILYVFGGLTALFLLKHLVGRFIARKR